MTTRITRRSFSAGVTAAVLAAGRSSRAQAGANEKVRLGFIGLGNRGDQLLKAFLPLSDIEVTALCDVYEPYMAYAAQQLPGKPFMHKDYRKVLERSDVDAVVIGTPDHWHALQFIDACMAGKDVYVEKPVSLTIGEGRKMIEAARRYDVISQVGTQRRSAPFCVKAAELVRSGVIGKVTVCRSFRIRNEWPMGIGNPPDSAPPSGLDWNMWLGPAPKVPYNENYCLYKFRWFRPYSGGQLTNFGVHFVDLIHMATGQDAPLSAVCLGGVYAVEDNRGIPDTLEALWEYPDGILVSFASYDGNGADGAPYGAHVEIRGTEGTMYINYNSFRIVPEKIRTAPIPANDPTDRKAQVKQSGKVKEVGQALVEKGQAGEAEHVRNFIDGVKSRKPCRCPIETGHRSTVPTLLANLAYDRRRYLTWDAEAERITNDPEANDLLMYEYRKPWKLPVIARGEAKG